jgi:multiple sugar transport system substrate-binding protein
MSLPVRLPIAAAAMFALALSGCVSADPEASSASSATSAGSPTTVTATAGGSGSATAVAPLVATDPAASVTLTWWTGQEAEGQQALEGLAKDFSTLHPTVSIKASSGAPTTDELLQKLSAGFAADSYPDISYAFGSWASELADSGRTLDSAGNVADPAVGGPSSPGAPARPRGRTARTGPSGSRR